MRILINLEPEKQLIPYQRNVRIRGIVPHCDFCPFRLLLQKFRSFFVWGLQYKETSVTGLIRFICIAEYAAITIGSPKTVPLFHLKGLDRANRLGPFETLISPESKSEVLESPN